MRVAVASGKGGTGKTTVATALAQVAVRRQATRLLDCDIEAPNAALFLHPTFDGREEAVIPVPRVDEDACTSCGQCADACRANALAVVGGKVLVFDDLCNGCGHCSWICPEAAIREAPVVIGKVDWGRTREGIQFGQGVLDIGQPTGMPVLRLLKKGNQFEGLDQDLIEIRDAPPGASCTVVETLRGADAAVLVTEPTAFGLHDLRQIGAVVKELGVPALVVINRDGIGTAPIAAYCAEQGFEIALRIPLQRRLAEGLARGRTLLDVAPEYEQPIEQLLNRLIDGDVR